MITCARAAERISNELDGRLPLASRVALGVHRMLCGRCRRYGRLLAHLDRAAAGFFDESAVAAARWTPDTADRLKAALRDRLAE